MNKKYIKPPWNWIIRVIGTCLFLWLITRNVDFQAIMSLISNFSLWTYFVLIFMYLLNQFLASLRWKILLDKLEIKISLWKLFKLILLGQILSQFLPSRIGGDAARIGYLIADQPEKKSEAVTATVMDRLLGLFALIIIVFLTVPFGSTLEGPKMLWLFTILSGIMLLSIYAFNGNLSWIKKIVNRHKLFNTQVGLLIKKWLKAFLRYRNNKRSLMTTLLISLLIQLVLVLGQYLTFVALGTQISLKQLFLVIPLVSLITTLPISLGGLGLREASLTALLNIDNNLILSYTLTRYSIRVFVTIFLFIEPVLVKIIKLVNENLLNYQK